MNPLGHGAIRFRHLGDLREHVAFAVRRAAPARGRLLLAGAFLHRGLFLVRERLGGFPFSHWEVPPFADRVAVGCSG
jgi:hypothetical protein